MERVDAYKQIQAVLRKQRNEEPTYDSIEWAVKLIEHEFDGDYETAAGFIRTVGEELNKI